MRPGAILVPVRHVELQGEDRALAMHFRGATSSSECQGERSVALSFERHQLMAQVYTPIRQTAGNSQRQLLVPTRDFAASLHRSGDGRIPGRVSRAEQVDQVERTLLSCIQAEVTSTGVIQQMTYRRIVSTLDILLDPIIHAQMVEPEPLLGKAGVGRRKTSHMTWSKEKKWDR